MTESNSKKEKEKVARETLGKYFYDLSKTAFGTGLLGQMLPSFMGDKSTNGFSWGLVLFCLLATIALAYTGNKFLRK